MPTASSLAIWPPPLAPAGDVLLETDEPVIRGGADVAHAGLLHDAPRADVLREADRDDLVEPDRAKTVTQHRDRGFRPIALAPRARQVVIGELDLRPGALDLL